MIFWRQRLMMKANREHRRQSTPLCPICHKPVLIRETDHGDGIPAYDIWCLKCDYIAGHYDSRQDAIQSLKDNTIKEYI